MGEEAEGFFLRHWLSKTTINLCNGCAKLSGDGTRADIKWPEERITGVALCVRVSQCHRDPSERRYAEASGGAAVDVNS